MTAVNTVTIATLAIISTSDEYNARISLFFEMRFRFGILQRSISLRNASVKGFSSTLTCFDRVSRMTNHIRLVSGA